MSDKPKVLHPIKDNNGKPIAPGTDLDSEKIGALRLARLIESGRVSDPNAGAPANRAEQKTGRPDLKPALKDGD